MLYYSHSAQQTLDLLKSSTNGLSHAEAKRRLHEYGFNEIQLQRTPLWRIILEPFANVFMAILAAAAGLSIFHDKIFDATIIIVIMAANAVIFYAQTYATQRVLRTLERKSEQKVTVLRAGKEVQINARLLVPGDVIVVHEGEKIPADARVLRSQQLRTNESQLTGESEPVSKQSKVLRSETPIFERSNMLYQGSFAVGGSATAIVTETANKTEFGSIARLVQKNDLTSPIQRKIDKLLGQIVITVLSIAIVSLGLALLRGMDLYESVSFVMALTVSAVPESLPVAISVILVLGMRRMAARKALVQTMRSIETIGAVTTIATDKTGTLTRNKLHVETTWQPDSVETDLARSAYKALSLSEGALTDPLDIAIESFATQEGIVSSKPRPLHSFAFDQERALSGSIWHDGGAFMFHIKGAPEPIIRQSTLQASDKKAAHAALVNLTKKGYRVLAIAHTPLTQPVVELAQLPASLHWEFDGLIAVIDPLRPEAKKAIRSAQNAGVTVRMITGDHAETAFFIGKQLGMVTNRTQVFDSRNMNTMSDDELTAMLRGVRVFARVVPDQKHRILTILKKNNITAMTGDGVNDVPALAGAHVGLAMGSGSSIARDAGDIILLDDNFKTIIDALKEGRSIIGNIRRMLFFLLSTNLSEVMTMIVSLLAGLPLPLLPVQILWVNLVTDSFMVIPLGLEPPSKALMSNKPLSPQAPILSKHLVGRMLLLAVVMAGITVGSFMYFLAANGLEYARTVAFHVLVVAQLAAAFGARSDYQSVLLSIRTWSPAFYIGLGLTITLHALTLYGPLGSLLSMSRLTMSDTFVLSLIAFVVPLATSELHKWYGRRTNAAASV